jgi:primosomal protein N''
MGIARKVVPGNVDDAVKKFETAAQDLNHAQTAELRGNQFLLQLFGNLGNKQFTEGLEKESSTLQKLSDEEQQQVLNAVANYSPALYYTVIGQAAKLIPEK